MPREALAAAVTPGALAATARRALLAAALTLTGCAATAPADLARQQLDVVPARFAAAHPSREGTIEDGWLRSFGDPTLLALATEAMAGNPDLAVAAARWEEAGARIAVARSLLLPRADAGAQAGGGDAGAVVPARETHSIGAQASWEIDLWGRLRAGVRGARDDAEAARLDWEAARLSLAAGVADAWFLAVAARELLEIDRDRLEEERRTATIVRDKVETGVGTQLEAELGDANVAAAAAAVARDEAAQQELVQALEALLGRYPASELAVSRRLPRIASEPTLGVPSQLLERRPDILAADRRVSAAFHQREAARAARLPQLTLTASLGSLLDPSAAIWSAGANLLAPVLSGGRLTAEQEIAGARQRQALAAYVSTAIDAFREVETALANEQHLAARHAELDEAAARMRNASRIAADRYEAGVQSIVELMVVRRQDFEIRAQLLQVRTDRLRQRLALHRALGGDFEQPATNVAASAAGNPERRR
ncbi:MAG TPA: efflux transporter outer membrane subunit [Candidatus Limnocylindrales bacterium]|nr:efflux transporter outer membrane subunit [Candidatus Limnocylindrales bacterium]